MVKHTYIKFLTISFFYYNLEYLYYSLRLPKAIASHSPIKSFTWNKVHLNIFTVVYRDYIAYFEYSRNNIFLREIKFFENIIGMKSDNLEK